VNIDLSIVSIMMISTSTVAGIIMIINDIRSLTKRYTKSVLSRICNLTEHNERSEGFLNLLKRQYARHGA
jgi:hypothetical protein